MPAVGAHQLRTKSGYQEMAQELTHRSSVCRDGGEVSPRNPGNPALHPRLIPPVAERGKRSAGPGKVLQHSPDADVALGSRGDSGGRGNLEGPTLGSSKAGAGGWGRGLRRRDQEDSTLC